MGIIVESKSLGVHIRIKSFSADNLILAIQKTQKDEIKSHVAAVGQQIKNENGLENAIAEIEKYFNDEQK